MKLPEDFEARMQKMLGDTYPAFRKSYDAPRWRGLRVNTLKITPEEFEGIAPFPVRRIPWVENGFFYPNDVYPARYPYYAAGLYYLQEPSAMTPASRLPVEPGDRVLDLCAAPGGKATELAAKLKGQGILVANDVSNARAKALLRNLELFGTENMFVTNETPERLREVFAGCFDKILVDAPCSGEGMFRKNPEVADTWSLDRVRSLAAQQREILRNAYVMLKPGGYLLYSTCTFSPDEDEQVVSWALQSFPDLALSQMEGYPGFSEGRPDWADGNPDLRRCIRIWPHKMDGEGHFLALFHKRISSGKPDAQDSTGVHNDISSEQHDSDGQDSIHKGQSRPGQRRSGRASRGRSYGENSTSFRPDPEQQRLLMEFIPDRDMSHVEKRGERGYYTRELPEGAGKLNFLRNGLYLGEWKKNRFEPSQPLAMAESSDTFSRVFRMRPEDERIMRYLHGETIETDPSTENVSKGWNLICVDRFPLGWGKYADGKIKNKYAVSWRV
ncbi:MAG: RsmB/NOP family class I SAM-dependent RNA methyltransferase [Bilifractor sp.]